ncbi:hypothetical protein LCGC14_2688530, partial [marine sediment metagenome]
MDHTRGVCVWSEKQYRKLWKWLSVIYHGPNRSHRV